MQSVCHEGGADRGQVEARVEVRAPRATGPRVPAQAAAVRTRTQPPGPERARLLPVTLVTWHAAFKEEARADRGRLPLGCPSGLWLWCTQGLPEAQPLRPHEDGAASLREPGNGGQAAEAACWGPPRRGLDVSASPRSALQDDPGKREAPEESGRGGEVQTHTARCHCRSRGKQPDRRAAPQTPARRGAPRSPPILH